MIKKIVSIILIFTFSALKVSALKSEDISAECAVVLTEDTGEIVFQKNANKKRSMASTTKIMTALLAAESGKLQNEVVITPQMVKVEGTSMGLLEGDKVSLDELMHGMLLQSGNDSANATAVYLGGSLENFSAMMNDRAHQIGMKATNFVTPSGLDSKEHYSTAYDMALLGREAVSNPKFLSICSKRKATLTYGNPPYKRTLYNHNKLLSSYDYALGIKTGFTKKSGRCLVSYAKKNGVGLIAVTLNAPNDWTDHKRMLDFGFDSVYSNVVDADIPKNIFVVGGNKSTVLVKSKNYIYSSVKKVNVSYKVYLNKFLYAPIKEGEVVGYWDLFVNDEFAARIPITTAESVI